MTNPDSNLGSVEAVVTALKELDLADHRLDLRSKILSLTRTHFPEGFTPASRMMPETRDALVVAVEQQREQFNGSTNAIINELQAFRLGDVI